MSYQYWELLTRMATGQALDLTDLCRELVRQSHVERLFCVVRRGSQVEVVAVDCDGYPLGYAEQRLSDSEFAEITLGKPAADFDRGFRVTRKVSRASKKTALIGSLGWGDDCSVSLLLENRFTGAELATLDDQAVEQMVVLAALAVRLSRASEARPTSPVTAAPVSGGRAAPLDRPVPSIPVVSRLSPMDASILSHPTIPLGVRHPSPPSSEELRETLLALQTHQGNISQSARALGMTRHGLKKRMRRLGIVRSANDAIIGDV